jgi:hypothetical protein
MDESVPDIWFDINGECNYCKMHDLLSADNPNDERGALAFDEMVKKTFENGKGCKYDVIVGVSGGTDSTYLLHLVKHKGLRVLAVHLDNGWNTETSVVNLRNILEALDIDLYTHVINWLEFKDILRSQLKSSLPWADSPTDLAIISILYRTAIRFGVKTIYVGNNFRTEGRQPNSWTHSDSRQLKHIHNKFGNGYINSYPLISPFELVFSSIFHGVKMYRPYYHLQFNKTDAKKLISQKYGWKDYGGHHHENIFTRYAIGAWMPLKFGIDKRKVTLSAYIRNSEILRENALATLTLPSYAPQLMEEDHIYIAKKLDFRMSEINDIWLSENRSFLDYPSYYKLFKTFNWFGTSVFKHILPFRPMMSYDVKKSGG